MFVGILNMLKHLNLMEVDIDFYFNVINKDAQLASRLLAQISKYHPESNIVVITDGTIPIASSQTIINHPKVVFIESENLKKHQTIGAFTTRNFTLALTFTTASTIIKLDPDSFLRKPITNVLIPEAKWQGLVRQVRTSWGLSTWANGGGWAMTRESMTKIVESNLLLDPCYTEILPFEESNGRCFEDCRLGHVANRLNIYPINCPGLLSSKVRSRTTIIHPVL